MSSSQRHKVDRKKREHKRDLHRAAKAMKASGLGPKRSKKSRETARLALKISNIHPDKEAILTKILKAREAARVTRSDKRLQKEENDRQEEVDAQRAEEAKKVAPSNKKALLYVAHSKSNDFTAQFYKSLEEMVYPIQTAATEGEETANTDEVHAEMPCSAYLVTVDARCAVQTTPWTLLDAIVDRGNEYATAAEAKKAVAPKKRGRDDSSDVTPSKRVLVCFALTKCDLVSSEALTTQFALLAEAVHRRYFHDVKVSSGKHKLSAHSLELPGGITMTMCPVSTQFDRCQKHLLKILRRFQSLCAPEAPKDAAKTSKKEATMKHNMADKVCVFIIGLPNTGRRTLARSLMTVGTDSAVAVVPLRAAQVQLVKSFEDNSVHVRFVLPSSKSITLVQLPEDAILRKEATEALASGDILFQSYSAVEKLQEPEAVAIMLAQGVQDPVQLAQAFCQPVFSTTGSSEDIVKGVAAFLRGIGHTVRREGGFHVSPLFAANAGTAGQLAATSLTASTGFASREQSNRLSLIDASFSNARPTKLVRISNISMTKKGKQTTVKRVDGHNALRIGARTFLREFCGGKNVPWAVLRAKQPLTPQGVADVSRVFSLALFGTPEVAMKTFADTQEYLNTFLGQLDHLMRDFLVLLPNGVVEFRDDAIVPVLHSLEEIEVKPTASRAEEDTDEEEDDEEEDDEEEDEEEDDEEEDDEEEDDEEIDDADEEDDE